MAQLTVRFCRDLRELSSQRLRHLSDHPVKVRAGSVQEATPAALAHGWNTDLVPSASDQFMQQYAIYTAVMQQSVAPHVRRSITHC